jgi:hypothetical protein
MAIANIRAQAAPIRKGPPCEVCGFIATLSEQDAADLRDLLSDSMVRYSVISEGLANDPDTPADLPTNSLSRHARGKCAARERLRG